LDLFILLEIFDTDDQTSSELAMFDNIKLFTYG